jgi:hypothetical protein
LERERKRELQTAAPTLSITASFADVRVSIIVELGSEDRGWYASG